VGRAGVDPDEKWFVEFNGFAAAVESIVDNQSAGTFWSEVAPFVKQHEGNMVLGPSRMTWSPLEATPGATMVVRIAPVVCSPLPQVGVLQYYRAEHSSPFSWGPIKSINNYSIRLFTKKKFAD
jgi:hypothetical protein